MKKIKNDHTPDTAVYRKKSGTSDTSQSKAKSNHKHKYKKCLILKPNSSWHLDMYCVYCGKIKHEWFFEEICDSDNHFRLLDDKEILEKYNDLPKFKTDSQWQKFVDIEGTDGQE